MNRWDSLTSIAHLNLYKHTIHCLRHVAANTNILSKNESTSLMWQAAVQFAQCTLNYTCMYIVPHCTNYQTQHNPTQAGCLAAAGRQLVLGHAVSHILPLTLTRICKCALHCTITCMHITEHYVTKVGRSRCVKHFATNLCLSLQVDPLTWA